VASPERDKVDSRYLPHSAQIRGLDLYTAPQLQIVSILVGGSISFSLETCLFTNSNGIEDANVIIDVSMLLINQNKRKKFLSVLCQNDGFCMKTPAINSMKIVTAVHKVVLIELEIDFEKTAITIPTISQATNQ